MKISDVIKALDKCIKDYSNSYGFFEPTPSEAKSVLTRLQACKSHLETTLKKRGDQTMDWLNPDYCLFHDSNFKQGISIQKILRILEKEVDSNSTSKKEWSIKLKPFFQSLISDLNKDPVFQVQIDERLNKAMVNGETFRDEYTAIALLREKDLFVQNADQLAKLLRNPSSALLKDHLNEIVRSLEKSGMLNQENFKKLLETIESHGNYFVELIVRNSQFLNQKIFDDMIKYLPVYKAILKPGSYNKLAYIFSEMIDLCNKYPNNIKEAQRNIQLLLEDYNLTIKLISELEPGIANAIGDSSDKFHALKSHIRIINAALEPNRTNRKRSWITPERFDEMIGLCEQYQNEKKDFWHAVAAVRAVESAYTFGNRFPAIAQDERRFAFLKKHIEIFSIARPAFHSLEPELLTLEWFDAMIDFCEKQSPRDVVKASQAINVIITRIMGKKAQEDHRVFEAEELNSDQSTHDASVERSISRSMMRLAQTGYDLFLKAAAVNPKDITLEALKESDSKVPTLIKLILNGKESFYVYGRAEEGKMQVVKLTTSTVLQAIDFNKKRENGIWVSKYQNKEIYHAITSKGHFPQGYSKVIKNKSLMDKAIKELQDWSNSLSDSDLTQKSAKAAIKKLTDDSFFKEDFFKEDYVDKGSQVTIRQMLALVWTAIHDETRRVGKLEDAKALLMEGFYEIQRGYNIDVMGKDNLSFDDTICEGGAFDKVLEKLQNIHPDVQMEFITPRTFTLKLPSVVREEAINHVKQYPEDSVLILKDGDFSSVKDKIKDAVRKRMWDEFGEKLCELTDEFDQPIMTKSTFEAAIDSIGSVGVGPSSFLLTFYSANAISQVKQPKNFGENVSLTLSQPKEEVKPKITTINITLKNFKNVEVGKLTVDVNTSGVDMMEMIKKQIDEREEMIVKATFSGQNYTSMDNDEKKNDLQAALKRSGQAAYILQVSASKKTDLDRLKEAIEKRANLSVQTMVEILKEDEENPLKEPLVYLKIAGGQHELETLSKTLAEFKPGIDTQCELLQDGTLKLQLTSANPPLSVAFYDVFEKSKKLEQKKQLNQKLESDRNEVAPTTQVLNHEIATPIQSTWIDNGFSSLFKGEVTSTVKEIFVEEEESRGKNIVLTNPQV